MIGIKRFMIGSAAAAGVLVAGTITANAAIFDFSGTGGNLLATSAVFNVGSLNVTANGFEVDTATNSIYTGANLFQRDDAPNDEGLGVCNSGDGACNTGDTNEIDNNAGNGVYDVIRLDVTGLTLISLGLSSLDDGPSENIDTAQIFFSDVEDLDLSPGNVTPDITQTESTQPSKNPDIDISSFTDFDFIYIAGEIGGSDDDFLLRNLVVEDPERQDIPEPTALGLLGFGLAGIGLIRRRRKLA